MSGRSSTCPVCLEINRGWRSTEDEKRTAGVKKEAKPGFSWWGEMNGEVQFKIRT